MDTKLAPMSSVKSVTTLQYPKCWVIYRLIAISGIAGFQENSIKYHILDKDGTQTLLLDSFKLLHEVHNSGGG